MFVRAANEGHMRVLPDTLGRYSTAEERDANPYDYAVPPKSLEVYTSTINSDKKVSWVSLRAPAGTTGKSRKNCDMGLRLTFEGS